MTGQIRAPSWAGTLLEKVMNYTKKAEFGAFRSIYLPKGALPKPVASKLADLFRRMTYAQFDLTLLNEHQRRDAAIDQCELEWIKALRRPLIR